MISADQVVDIDSLNPNTLLTTGEVAVLLRVCKETVRRWRRSGELKAVRPGNREWLYEIREVKQMMRGTKGYRADLETMRPTDLLPMEYLRGATAPSNAPGLDEKLTDIIELLALIADGSAHRGANEARICEIKDKYGL